MFNKKKKGNKGFTLVELLVVIAIIGILAILAVPALFDNINKAKATDVVADVRAIKTAVMSEYAEDSNTSGSKLAGLNNAENTKIQSDLNIQDFSGEGDYKLSISDSTAKVEVTVDNLKIAKKASKELLGSESTSTTFVVTIYSGNE